MSKNIVLCCDDNRHIGTNNIVAIYRNVSREDNQISLYFSSGFTYALLWLFFGDGVRATLEDIYESLVTRFEPGDRVFLLGSGRSAFIVHSFAGLLASCGLVREADRQLIRKAYRIYSGKHGQEAVDFKERFSRECTPYFIGMLDAVPLGGFRERLIDRSLPAGIQFAYHGMALDESRFYYPIFLWDETRKSRDQVMEQVWFPGDHGDLAGLKSDKGLSDCPLMWLLQKAEQSGLSLQKDWEQNVRPRPAGSSVGESRSLLRFFFPPQIRKVPDGALVHQSVIEKSEAEPDYRPGNLPIRYVTVPWKADRALDELKLETELESIREAVKGKPSDLKLWQRLAEVLQALKRDNEYAQAISKLQKLRNEAAFDANVGREIRLTGLEVNDLDFFGSFRWTLNPQMNVLLGKNGYGKSHLLTLVVALLQGSKEHADDFITERSRRNVSIDLRVIRDGEVNSLRFTKLGFEESSVGRVPLLAISELRFVDKSRHDFGKEDDIGDEAYLKVNGAHHFLHRKPLGPVIHDFLHRLCITYTDRKTLNLPIIQLFEDVVHRLTATDFRLHKIERLGNSARYRIEVLSEGNEEPVLLQQASQGTLSVMSMVGLIFDFLRAVFPDVSETELTRKPAIVLIDELDAHMHPSWQRKILGILRNTFPAVQFIVAAHSPLVVAGCKEGEVAVLRRSTDGRGFRLEQLGRHFLGATTSQLYSLIFEIEEKDETYLKYSAMYPFRADIEEEVKALEIKKKLNSEDKLEFDNLVAQSRAVARAESGV